MANYTPLPSIKNTREIRDLAIKGRRFTFEGLTLYFKPNYLTSCRVAIAVRKKTGKAVIRNLIKRRIKDILRLQQNHFRIFADLLIVVNPNPCLHEFSSLNNMILQVLNKLGMLKSINCLLESTSTESLNRIQKL